MNENLIRLIILIVLWVVGVKSGLEKSMSDWVRSRGIPEKVIIIIAFFFFTVWAEAPWIIVVLSTCAIAYAALATKVDE